MVVLELGFSGRAGGISKGHEETFGGNRNGHYLDCTNGSIGAYMCQNLAQYMLQICMLIILPKKLLIF